jgi:cyclopropane fatty-acyl-phospholipid synthase-like methyltransferase
MSDNKYGKDFWDERYQSDSYLYGEAPNDFLVENIDRLKSGGRILCLSEGEGRNAVYLALQGFQVTCVDLSSTARGKALKLAEQKGVELTYDVSDLNEYDLGEEQWDGVISIFGHTPSRVRRKLHHKIKNSLKKSGVLLLEGYSTEQLKYDTGGPKDQDMLYTTAELEEDFAELKIHNLQGLIRNINEGAAHTGESSVIQLVAQK